MKRINETYKFDTNTVPVISGYDKVMKDYIFHREIVNDINNIFQESSHLTELNNELVEYGKLSLSSLINGANNDNYIGLFRLYDTIFVEMTGKNIQQHNDISLSRFGYTTCEQGGYGYHVYASKNGGKCFMDGWMIYPEYINQVQPTYIEKFANKISNISISISDRPFNYRWN